MSKIDPEILKNISHASPGPSKSKGRPGHDEGDRFGNILDEKLENSDNGTKSRNVSGLGEIQGTFRSQQLKFEFDAAAFKNRLEFSINDLETYAWWLLEPGKTLKDAKSLLQRISEQTRALKNELAPHISTNKDLAGVLDRLMTTVEIEHVKLDRGDYL